MGSSFMGIETAKRSLFAHQTALQTTGQNIANADTAGYSRQRVNLVASQPMEAYGLIRSTVPGQIGQGVEFSSINRVREKFLDDQFMTENKTLGEWEVRDDTMQKLEAVLNEPSDTGIRTVMENFWKSWQELSKNPEDSTARSLVKESALALTDAFNHMGKQLQDLSKDISSNINIKAGEVNSTLRQISSLNYEISRVEGLGDNANDLRDQRDLLTDGLSKIVNIRVNEVSGGYEVTMGGETLVTPGEEPAEVDSDFLESAYAAGDLTSGEIFGMVHSRDVSVANFSKQLDTMVKAMAEGDIKVTLPAGTVLPEGTVLGSTTYSGSVAARTLSADTTVTVKGLNALHELGYAADGSTPPKSGIPFFTKKTDGDWSATSITVNPDIVSNIANISSSMRTYEDSGGAEHVVPGNNSMALLLAGVQNANVDFASLADGSDSSSGASPGSGISGIANGTFSGFFQAMVSSLGVQAQESSRQVANQTVLVQQVDSNRQSVSGVSLDEEMADMLKFQHAYNAAARLMTTMDELLDKIINSTGVVGR